MGPTNIALVKLLRADTALREATERYDSANKTVKSLERRLADLNEKLRLAQATHRDRSAKAGNLELDVKARDERIEKLRTQQAAARNNTEYQAFLTEINTEKVDKGKSEDEQLKQMEEAEKLAAEIKALHGSIEDEGRKYQATKEQLSGKLAALQAELDLLRPAREAAASAVPAKPREMFERLTGDDEEPMAAISRPKPKREEYVCTSCNKDLVVDLYNRLHTRDEVVVCPSCRRLLYIPDDLPPELAVNQKKAPREKAEAVEAPAE